jgi:hypothetical protein
MSGFPIHAEGVICGGVPRATQTDDAWALGVHVGEGTDPISDWRLVMRPLRIGVRPCQGIPVRALFDTQSHLTAEPVLPFRLPPWRTEAHPFGRVQPGA